MEIVYRFGSTQNRDFEDLKKLVNEIFSETFSEDFPLLISKENISNSYFATYNEEIIANVSFYPINFYSNGITLKAAGIGAVSTKKEFRKKGISKKLLRDVLKKLEDDGYDIAILWGDLHEFYRDEGFDLVGGQRRITFNKQVKINTEVEITNNKNLLVTEGLNLYLKSGFRVMRSQEEWQVLANSNNTKFYTAEKNNKLEAYVAFEKGLDFKNYIHEWAGDEDALLSICNFIQNEKKEFNIIGANVNTVFFEKLKAYGLKEFQEYFAMIKILNTKNIKNELVKKYGIEASKIILEKDKFGYENLFLNQLPANDLAKLVFGPEKPTQFFDFKKHNVQLNKFFPLVIWCYGLDSV